MNAGAVHLGARLVHIGATLTLALLAGCSCCGGGSGGPTPSLTFVVDEATATRLNAGPLPPPPRGFYAVGPECRQECDVLAGHADAGAADANIPNAGAARPTLPGGSCFIEPSGASWLLSCSYFRQCPA